MARGSNLVGIESAEEDVFVQHLHHGQPSWIGLNDQANEGVYLWTDGGPVLYTHWAPGVSTPLSEDKDCVESSGRDLRYHWQLSSCDNCRDFTCKKGKISINLRCVTVILCNVKCTSHFTWQLHEDTIDQSLACSFQAYICVYTCNMYVQIYSGDLISVL